MRSSFISVDRTQGKPASEGKEGNTVGLAVVANAGSKYLLVMAFVFTAFGIYFFHAQLKAITVAFFVGAGLALLGKVIMIVQHHRLDLQARRNDISVVWGSEQGAVLLLKDRKPIQATFMGLRLPWKGVIPDPDIPIEPQIASFVSPMQDTNVTEVSEPTLSDALAYVQTSGIFTPAKDMTTGDWIPLSKMASIGIAGVTGAGKTVTTALLILETKVKYAGTNVKLLVIDPHAQSGSPDALASRISSLKSSFLTDPVYEAKDVNKWITTFWEEAKARAEGRAPIKDAWLLVWDEFASSMTDPALAAIVAPMLEKINGEGRKLAMYSIINSREWKAERVGGTMIRRSIPTFLVHRLPQDIVGTVIPLSDAYQGVPQLPDGHIAVYSSGRLSWGKVPMVNESDLSQYDVTTGAVDGDYRELPQILPGGITQTQIDDVRSYFLQGRKVEEIAQLVFGSISVPNRAKVMDALRIALGSFTQGGGQGDNYNA